MLTLQTSFKPFAQVGEGVKSVVEMTVNSEEELAWEVLLPPPRPVEEDYRRQIQNRLCVFCHWYLLP